MWIRVWGSLVGFKNLQNKCLVEVDYANKIRMHDHLRDLGRYIADTSTLMARRLWRPVINLPDLLEQLSPASVSIIPTFESVNSFQDFIFKVMFHILCCNCLMLSKHKQTEVRGIRMATQSIQRNTWGEQLLTLNGSSSDEVLEIKRLQLLEAEGDFVESIWAWVRLPNLLWLRWNKCPCSSLPSSIPMHHLRVLEVSGSNLERLWQCESQVPLQLRELNIAGPLLEFPKSLGQLKHLEKIEAGYSYAAGVPLASLPEEFCDLCSLKYLTLRAYNNLQVLPSSFGRLTNLQEIVLDQCKSLKMLPDSFGGLTNLQSIRLIGCDSLKKLPDSLENLTNLQSIHIYGKSLEILPYSLGNLKNLQHIFVRSACLKILPNSFGNLTNLLDIDFSECELLKMLPNSLENLKNLQYIKLAGCENLKKLPDSLGSLRNLKSIDLKECESLDKLPDSLGNLSNLQRIDLSRCENLKRLPDSLGDLPNLQGINLSWCESLELLPESFGNLTNLESIDLSGCESLEMLPNSVGHLTNLKSIDLTECRSLKMLPNSFGNLLQLKHLHLRGCCSLTIFSETLGNIIMLECLDLSRCFQMELLPLQVGNQKSLKKINLAGTNLKELPSDVLCFRNLEFLRLGGPLLEVPPLSLGYLTSLKELWLRKCENLQCLPDSIGLLTQLTVLNISRCGIQYLPPTVMKMNNLKVLTVCRCPLIELPFKRTEGDEEELLSMVQLNELKLYHTDISQVIFPAGICRNLKHLKICHCRNLVEVGAFPTALITLHLRYCGALTKIEGLSGLAQLQRMDITGSTHIKEEELPGHETLISLKEPIKTHDFSFNLDDYIASLEEDEEDVQWTFFCGIY